ncbi:MAG: aminotransferase class I/II-fold pyridoxal phosphate-dependent enzyme [Gemmataceae bacterium]|nr:aminotransferase class I/II-fold pyridoxal phosphate-dependent enzyme [Gemmataceae bacterium]MCI0743532.1 aminotransferase class I/II-fold pyridoxal phosphate-dependent enzyme [Gemmataceae bacterium]
MLDFTRAHYLGMRHASWELAPWAGLTTGAPAALVESPGAPVVAQRLAALQRCGAAVLGPSTLHLFWDLFALLASRRTAIFMDGAAYAIARWGAACATTRGARLVGFRHYDPDDLQRVLRRTPGQPLIVADGVCPGCGRTAPLLEMLELAQNRGGRLILDDTQALGVLGQHGGGTLARRASEGSIQTRRVSEGSIQTRRVSEGAALARRASEGHGADVILVASLAKAFGVPAAVLSGSRANVDWFREHSETRVHCSPPSAVAIRAAEHALRVNQENGDALRHHLRHLVRHFQLGIAKLGLSAIGGTFPMQTLTRAGPAAPAIHEQLLEGGIRTVLLRGTCRVQQPHVAVLLTAQHTTNDIDRLVESIALAGQLCLIQPQKEMCNVRHLSRIDLSNPGV